MLSFQVKFQTILELELIIYKNGTQAIFKKS